MSIIDKIREYAASASLKKLALQEGKPSRFKFSACKSVGIVYNAGNNAETRAAIELFNKLKGDGKQVATLGYFDFNRKKATVHPKLGFDYFYKSDVDWQLKPKNGIVDTFTNTGYDLIIDLETQQQKPLEFVIALSKAQTKAGRIRQEGPMLYDFMIGGISNENIDTFAAQLIHYLKLLNN